MPNPTPIPPGDGFDPTELERLHELILEHFLASARLATHLEAMRRSARPGRLAGLVDVLCRAWTNHQNAHHDCSTQHASVLIAASSVFDEPGAPSPQLELLSGRSAR